MAFFGPRKNWCAYIQILTLPAKMSVLVRRGGAACRRAEVRRLG